MSDKDDIETSVAKLEEGEIDESNDATAIRQALESSSDNSVIYVGEVVPQEDDRSDDDIPLAQLAAMLEAQKNQLKNLLAAEESNSQKVQYEAFSRDQVIEYCDEDEMLCVRGASPVFFVVEQPSSYVRKSSSQENDNNPHEITPPKRRKTSGKRRRKRTTPRKICKDRSLSSNERDDAKSMRRSESPPREKLTQLCKFFLQGNCAKGYCCEYMHSEFPCKYYYMGLKCEDEDSEEGCKLSHGHVLSPNMLQALTRHIHTAPNNVLGKKFVEIRSNMKAGEANEMLHDMQDKLKLEKSISTTATPEPDPQLFAMLKEKLYFLNEDQLIRLQELKITKVEDLLNLTLAQLNGIGIHAIQIEAIQMSLVAGTDTDMRTIYPPQLEPIPNFEVVCYDTTGACPSNWYEDEERPLIIDETKVDHNETQRVEDEVIIDVVGDAASPEGICEETIVRELVIEPVVPQDHSKEYESNTAVEINISQDDAQQSVESEVISPSKNLVEPTEKLDETTDNQINQNQGGQEELVSSSNQEEPLAENTQQDDDVSPLVSDMINREIEMESLKDLNDLRPVVSPSKEIDQSLAPEEREKTHTHLPEMNVNEENERTFTASPKADVNVESSRTKTPSPTVDINKRTKKNNTPLPKMQEDIVRTPSPKKTIPTLKKRSRTPTPEKDWDAIDLTETTPPKKSASSSKVEPKPRNYNNPFHRIIISPDTEKNKRFSPPPKSLRRARSNTSPENEPRKRFSPLKSSRKNENDSFFNRQVIQKHNDPMQGDNSSEDWDADEQIPTQTPTDTKNQTPIKTSSEISDCIDSPDPSDNEASSAFAATGTFHDLPLRTPNLDNYKPALEINAHLTYPAMEYKLYEIFLPQTEVNKPSLVDKLLKANSTDPRLKKFIEKEKNYGVFPQADYSFFPPSMSQCDPRLRPGHGSTCNDPYYNASPILYSYLQRSLWYQELKSNLKIQINHSVSDLVRALNSFHKDPSPRKIFDLFQIDCAGVLFEVMRNVGIFIDANGNITEEPNYNQLCVPLQQQQQLTSFGNPSSCMGHVPKPGLLGFAPPGMQHSHQSNQVMSHESIFIRQAFGNDYIGNINSGEFPSSGNTFYVDNRGPIHNEEFDNEPGPYRRQGQKRTFKRR